MRVLILVLFVAISLNSKAANISDFSGLENYIDTFQKRMAQGDEKWGLDNDPRYIHLAKTMGTTPDKLKSEVSVGNYPSLRFDGGVIECSSSFGGLTIVVVKHLIRMEGVEKPYDDLAIYLRGHDNQWWITRNQNFRFALAYFDNELDSLKSNKSELARMANDPCLNLLNF